MASRHPWVASGGYRRAHVFNPPAPELTTLDDIGFDGHILHTDGDTSTVLCNPWKHVGHDDYHRHHAGFYDRINYAEVPRSLPRAIPQITFAKKPDWYYLQFIPPGYQSAGQTPAEFAMYVFRTRRRLVKDMTQTWIWANKPQLDLQDHTPNYALINGLSDVAWDLMESFLC